MCQISYLYEAGVPLIPLSHFDQMLRKSLRMTTSDMFLILLSPRVSSLQFSTRQVFMEETTTAALLSPTAASHPSCAGAAGRCVVGRWCVSRTHTSTFTASPAKVMKKKHTSYNGNTPMDLCSLIATPWSLSHTNCVIFIYF